MEHGMLGWMTQLAQDRPSINVVQHVIVIVGQILESTVIEKNIIRTLSAFWLRSKRIGASVGSIGAIATPVL